MLNNVQLSFLVDSGSSVNAISRKASITANLELEMNKTRSTFTAANGTKITEYGICRDTMARIGDWVGEVEDLHVFDLPEMDVILGIPWLEKANPTIDWAQREIKFAKRFRISTKEQFKQDVRMSESIFVVNVTNKVIKSSTDSSPSDLALEKLLYHYSDLFVADLPSCLPPSRPGIDHRIRTESNARIPQKNPYRLSHAENLELQRQIEDLLKKGLITKSNSPYSSPVLFVRKKDGTMRMCIDYRALNDITIKDRFPLPHIGDLLDQLSQARYFSKIDLRSGYNQVLVDPRDRHKTAFVTNEGQYEYNVMSFGLCNAPGTFQRLMNDVFMPFMKGKDRFLIVYLDDIVIFSKTKEEHQSHVRQVLDTLRKNKLYPNPKKCMFLREEIDFVGHVVGHGLVKMDPEKISAVRDRAIPKNPTEVRSFLGLANYYRRFIRDFSKIAGPLHDLTSNTKFEWTEKHDKAFNELKARLTEEPVLILPDFGKEFRIMTDASNDAIGAVLSQKGSDGREHPIAYASRRLSPTEQRYATRDKELYALVFALKHWRPYLHEQKFVAETDHQSLTYLRTSRDLTPRLARWNDLIAEYDFEIVYKPGKKNGAADALSRPPTECRTGESSTSLNDLGNRSTEEEEEKSRRDLQQMLKRKLLQEMEERNALKTMEVFAGSVLAITRTIGAHPTNENISSRNEPRRPKKMNTPTEVQNEVKQTKTKTKNSTKDLIGSDPMFQKSTTLAGKFAVAICNAYKRDPFYENLTEETIGRYPNYKIMNGLIYVLLHGETRLCIPQKCDQVILTILHDFHEADAAGHPGIQKCYDAIRKHFYWNRMYKQIEEYVRSCAVCQKNKPAVAPQQMIRPLDVPPRRMSEVSMDFVSGLPTSEGFDQITVVVDRLTKKVLLYGSRKDNTAMEAAAAFLNNFVSEYGLPDKIISDRDVKFTASFWQELTSRLGVRLGMSTAFHPQTDGQTERMNRVLIEMLRTMGVAYRDNWMRKLKLVQFNINNSISSATGFTPFYAFAAFNPRVIDTMPLRDSKMQTMHDLANSVDEITQRVQDELLRSQQLMYRMTASNDPTIFQKGDYVLVSTAHFETFLSKAIQKNRKLGPKFVGPFEIIQMMGPSAAKLKLPKGYRAHPTINTSYLRKFIYDKFKRDVPPEPEIIRGKVEYEVDYIVDVDYIRRKHGKYRNGEKRYLVVWKGHDVAEATWEPEANLQNAQEAIAAFWERNSDE